MGSWQGWVRLILVGFWATLMGSGMGVIGCAQEGIPPGGPADQIPPRIVETWPKSDTTRVARDTEIQIFFTERINQRNLADALFISPRTVFDINLNWSGNRITLIPRDSLLAGQTYVVTVGTTLRDMSNNALGDAYTFAFSTGEQIDQGEITGEIAFGDQSARRVLVWAFNLKRHASPDPAEDLADYTTQTGQSGRYRLSNLSPGTYRVFALLDRGRDGRYHPQRDPLGIPSRDLEISPEQPVTRLNLELALRDTTRPQLLGISALDRTHLVLYLTEPLATEMVTNPAHYRIFPTDSTASEPLAVQQVYPVPADSTQVHLVTTPQRETTYRLAITGLQDRAGLSLLAEEEAAFTFRGNAQPDTSRPWLLDSTPQDRDQQVTLQPALRLVFSEAMETASVTQNIRLRASGDSLDHKLADHWPTAALVELVPVDSLRPHTSYRLTLNPAAVLDLAGNPLIVDSRAEQNTPRQADSLEAQNITENQDTAREANPPEGTWSILFTTLDPDTLGILRGQVEDPDPAETGPIQLELQAQQGRQVYRTSLAEPGPFGFYGVVPGNYWLFAYRDRNGNGRLDLGQALPFIPAERTTRYPESIYIRPGWETTGVKIGFDALSP